MRPASTEPRRPGPIREEPSPSRDPEVAAPDTFGTDPASPADDELELHIVLVEPEIPQNTGNVARTCSAIGAELHLVGPLGFSLEDRFLKRAGLDYWKQMIVETHDSLDEYQARFPEHSLIYTSKRAKLRPTEIEYRSPCSLVFGKETKGLPLELLRQHKESTIRIPMREGIRCLNLSNAVAIVAYEAFRSRGFSGLV